jgi:hypothetical protein
MSKFSKDIYGRVTSFVLSYLEEEEKYPSYAETSRELGISWDDAKLYSTIIENKEELNLHTDNELRQALAESNASRQNYMDKNRILRKDIREYDRMPNAIKENQKEMIKLLKQEQFHDPSSATSRAGLFKLLGDSLGGVGIIQISDPHLNELVKLAGINIFNIGRASKMFRKLTTYAIWTFKQHGFKQVLVASTGDILNSDRRVDEKLSMAANRTKAKFIAIDLIQAMLRDLANHFDAVHFAGVTGNETRVADELGWSELMVTDNYDYDIYKTLEYQFASHPKIHVFEQDNYAEYPILINGQWWLLIHGHSKVVQGDVEKGIIQLTGKWSDHGYKIAFVLLGHLHYTRIGDHFARGGSMVGANAYSNRALELITKSSQLIHFVFDNGDIFNQRIDLTNVDNVTPYNWNKELESYNPKSRLKTKQGRTILEIRSI